MDSLCPFKFLDNLPTSLPITGLVYSKITGDFNGEFANH